MSRRNGRIRPTDARRDHTYVDAAGVHRERAWFTQEEANRASSRVHDLTGRRYAHYPCRDAKCGGWHIRPYRLRPADLAESA